MLRAYSIFQFLIKDKLYKEFVIVIVVSSSISKVYGLVLDSSIV